MCIESLLQTSRQGVRSRATRILLTVGSALLVSLPQAALAQTSTVCGPEVKEEVVKALAGLEGASDEQTSWRWKRSCTPSISTAHRMPSWSRRRSMPPPASAVRLSPTSAASSTRK